MGREKRTRQRETEEGAKGGVQDCPTPAAINEDGQPMVSIRAKELVVQLGLPSAKRAWAAAGVITALASAAWGGLQLLHTEKTWTTPGPSIIQPERRGIGSPGNQELLKPLSHGRGG
jgi:hypothetical protein